MTTFSPSSSCVNPGQAYSCESCSLSNNHHSATASQRSDTAILCNRNDQTKPRESERHPKNRLDDSSQKAARSRVSVGPSPQLPLPASASALFCSPHQWTQHETRQTRMQRWAPKVRHACALRFVRSPNAASREFSLMPALSPTSCHPRASPLHPCKSGTHSPDGIGLVEPRLFRSLSSPA